MSPQNSEDTFDIIIIGAGTAGSVLASHLSSNPSLRVLVLEAGENRNEDPNVRTPGLTGNLLGNPTYDWKFRTSPEHGLNGRVIHQPRGRLWGGSSAINSHVLVYPSKGYHDAWDTLLGAGANGKKEGEWSWEGIGRYYKQFQALQEPNANARRELQIPTFGAEDGDGSRNNDVGIQASYPVTPHVLQKAWVESIQDLGYNSSKDPLDGEVIGGSTTRNALDAKKGERSHAGIAFLEPSMKRENLVIKSNVLVGRILFAEKKQNGKLVAAGVAYSEEGRGEVVDHAHKEVIVCAGTYGSPKILELSGIGQRGKLETAGIKCLYDLPGVGGYSTHPVCTLIAANNMSRKSPRSSQLWSFRGSVRDDRNCRRGSSRPSRCRGSKKAI
jgi:choline dehydrogenase-like flavoprotein